MIPSIGRQRAEEARNIAEQMIDHQSRQMMLQTADDNERRARRGGGTGCWIAADDLIPRRRMRGGNSVARPASSKRVWRAPSSAQWPMCTRTLIQSGDLPDRYGRSRRLATPSRPIAQ